MGRPDGLVGGRCAGGGDGGAGRLAGGASGGGVAAAAAGRTGAAGGRAAGGAVRGGAAGGGTATSLAGRLVTRRGRAAGSRAGAGAGGAGDAAARAGALVDAAAGRGAAGSVTAPWSGAVAPARLATAGLAGGSSGWTGRRKPSASALRRTRSAWASSIDDEWLFTPMPRDRLRSSASLFVSPSSRANS